MTLTRFQFCVVFLTLAAWSYAQPTSRIFDGEGAQTRAFPYVASLRLDNAHYCGGSIISSKHILTAAHCVMEKDSVELVDVERLSVRVGSTNQYGGGKLLQVTNATVHPEYKDFKNDLAILTLDPELIWTGKIESIAYAKNQSQEPPVAANVTIAGWGELQNGQIPYKLQYTNLSVATEEACTNAFTDNDNSIICLSHRLKQGICKGDGGSGAVYENTLVAVSNFVIGACGSRYPDVFANVAYYAQWIESVLKEN